MRSTLTLLGMYEYDDTILDNFVLPAEWTEQEQADFKAELLFDTAELEMLYSNPVFLKTAIGFWSRTYINNWEKLYATQHFDYNPIWNKDGKITETENIGRTNSYNDKRDGSGSAEQNRTENTANEETNKATQHSVNTQTNDLDQTNTSTQQTESSTKNDVTGSNKQTTTTSSQKDTTTGNTTDTTNDTTVKDYVFGFNEATAAQSEQHETNATGKTTSSGTQSETGSGTDTVEGSSTQNNTGSGSEKVTINADQINTGTVNDDGTVTNDGTVTSKGGAESRTTNTNISAETLAHNGSDDEDRNYTRIEQGNIGITTTQQMIREERDVDTFNLQDYIIDSFKQRFCLLVY